MKLAKLVLSFLLIIILVLPVQANASSANNEQTGMTPENYSNYLLDLSKTDSGALDLYEEFNNLTNEEQIAFVGFLYSQEYFEVLTAAASGIEIDKSYTNDNNVEIPVIVKSTIDEDLNLVQSSASTAATSVRAWTTPSIELNVMGITTTQFVTTLTWEYEGTQATKIHSVTQGHTNFNPALIVSDDWAQPNGISSGKAYGVSNFTLRPTSGLGFVAYSLRYEVRASTLSNRQHAMSTGHPNIKNFSWTNY